MMMANEVLLDIGSCDSESVQLGRHDEKESNRGGWK